jgi:hypothetical protein
VSIQVYPCQYRYLQINTNQYVIIYSIYFDFSNSFAKIQLGKLKIYYKCDYNSLNSLNETAKKRNFILKEYTCEDNENINILLGVIVLCLFSIVIIRIYKKLNLKLHILKNTIFEKSVYLSNKYNPKLVRLALFFHTYLQVTSKRPQAEIDTS